MIVYKDVFQKLKNAGYNSTRLRKEKLLPQQTMQNIREGKAVTTDTIDKICKLTGCKVEEVIEYVENDYPNRNGGL